MSGIPRNAILDMLYRGTQTLQEFNWDQMSTVPILALMTKEEVDYIKKLITSPRLSGNNRLKIKKIDEIMHARGFTKFAGGTNRIVYTHPSAPNAVFKIAIDSVGIRDNPAEFYNQQFLKPYCCKVFECSPCGTIASFEKVDRITTFEEFYSIADDYFYLLSKIILGKYVMDDIGIDYFMNIAIRKNFGIVLIDFPYLFELDGRKLNCGAILDDGSICNGEIDYDDGFNQLLCKKCKRKYRARDLAKSPEMSSILIREDGGRQMTFELTRGNQVIDTFDTTVPKTDYVSKYDRTTKKKSDKPIFELVRGSTVVDDFGHGTKEINTGYSGFDPRKIITETKSTNVKVDEEKTPTPVEVPVEEPKTVQNATDPLVPDMEIEQDSNGPDIEIKQDSDKPNTENENIEIKNDSNINEQLNEKIKDIIKSISNSDDGTPVNQNYYYTSNMPNNNANKDTPEAVLDKYDIGKDDNIEKINSVIENRADGKYFIPDNSRDYGYYWEFVNSAEEIINPQPYTYYFVSRYPKLDLSDIIKVYNNIDESNPMIVNDNLFMIFVRVDDGSVERIVFSPSAGKYKFFFNEALTEPEEDEEKVEEPTLDKKTFNSNLKPGIRFVDQYGARFSYTNLNATLNK